MCVLKVYFASNNMNSLKKYELLKKKYKKINKSCEICSTTQKQKIQSIGRVARPGDYGELKIYICKNCGYKFQNPSYPDKFFKEYFYHGEPGVNLQHKSTHISLDFFVKDALRLINKPFTSKIASQMAFLNNSWKKNIINN